MAITTAAGAANGVTQSVPFAKVQFGGNFVVGRVASYWATTGYPAAGTYDTTLNGVALTSPVTGQLPFTDPASGKTYLASMKAVTSNTGAVSIGLADRLWHNGGIDVTSTLAQSITSPTFPARDIAGSTNGDGVFLAVEVSSATGAGTPTITISYTNQSGTSGRTATNIDATVASTAAGYMIRMGLQAGDTGVRSVQSITLSATWTSGTINIVAYRPIAMLESFGMAGAVDAITSGFPVLFDGSVPYLLLLGAGVSAGWTLSGSLQFTQG